MQGAAQTLNATESLREASSFHELPKHVEAARRETYERYQKEVEEKMEEVGDLLTPSFQEVAEAFRKTVLKSIETDFKSVDADSLSRIESGITALMSNEEEAIEALFTGQVKTDLQLLADKSFRQMSDLAIDSVYEKLVGLLAPLAPSQFRQSLKRTRSLSTINAPQKNSVRSSSSSLLHYPHFLFYLILPSPSFP